MKIWAYIIRVASSCPATVSTSNHMFGKTIWDKFLDCFFENFEIVKVKRRQFQNFQNYKGNLSPKSPNQTFDYWLITPRKYFVLKLISFNKDKLKISEREISGAMLITISRVIII